MLVYLSESKSLLSSKKGSSAICSISALPKSNLNGKSNNSHNVKGHPSDDYRLVALATPSKLLVISMMSLSNLEICFKIVRPSNIALTSLPCTSWKPGTLSIYSYFLFIFFLLL